MTTVSEAIKKLATPISDKNRTEIKQIATIAGNNDPSVGEVLAKYLLLATKVAV